MVTDFAVDPAHATLGDPHEVSSPNFDNFQLTLFGTFNVNKCYEVMIKREGGAPCGSANSSGNDTAVVFADHIIADISPNANADFKAADNWRIEIGERAGGCTGGSVVDVFPNASGESYLRIRGCNDTCLLNSATMTAVPNPVGCGDPVQVCALKSGGGTLGSGNLEYDWDLDGDGICGVCSGGSNNGNKCGEATDCPGGTCFGGGGFDDLTTNTGDPGCLPDQPCCITINPTSTLTVGVKIRDKGTNVPCTECRTTLITVTNDCSDGQFCNGTEICDPVTGCQPGTPPNCDDGVACTKDSCNESNDTCVHTPHNSSCDDEQYCNGAETCHPTLGCQPGTPPNCGDGVSCTVDTCNEATDSCVRTPNNAACTDGAFCNGTETCDAVNGCQAGTPPNCNDDVGCTIDACNEANDTCTNTADNSACNNGAFCDGGETCHPTLGCQGGTAPNCDDGVPCTHDSCNEAADTCDHATDNALCSDGAYCNGNETCHATLDCQAGTAPNCNDGVSCTVDTCNEGTDSCDHAPNNAACDDGQFCTGVETCDPINDCTSGTPPNCSDGVACTIDSCNESTDSCDHATNNAFCDNVQFCDGSETCHATLGCQAGTPPNCNDGVICTIDACDEAGDTCTHTPDHASCSNGSFCDGTESCDPLLGCQDGTDPCNPPTKCDEPNDRCVTCLSDAQCNDGLFCTGVETCNTVTGLCVPGTPPSCDDSVSCTIDACNPGLDACTHTLDNAACGNGQHCDGDEICHATLGCQPGTPPNCDDGVMCTVDSCNETTDSCDHAPNDSACSDGLHCTGVETCDPINGCQAGTPPNCSDGIACTTDACNESTDSCDHTPVDSVCSDGQHCNGVETCDVLLSCQAGTPPDCNDNVGCTVDTCDEANDACEHVPNHAACNDMQFCNGLEFCDPQSGCQAGTPPNCADGVACTVDACDEANDTCINTPSDAFCNDLQFCNGVEFCHLFNDCQPGTPPNCDDLVACTVDACDEVNDVCTHTPDHDFCDDPAFCNGDEFCDAQLGCQDAPDPCQMPTKCDEANDRCVQCLTHEQCDDGLFCTGLEFCDPLNGTCQGFGAAPSCNDGVPCTLDFCNPNTDSCDHAPENFGCVDGDFCNGVEYCHPLLDCQPGTPPDCDDGVACTVDSCNESTDGCDHTPDDNACSNGQFCDGVELCHPINGCQPGTPPNCNDGVACTIDACDEFNDVCTHTPDDAPCNDQQFCNGVEYCDPLAGCRAGTPPNCDDGVGCTVDSCDEAGDTCVHMPNDAACDDLQHCNGVEFCDPLNDCQPGTPPNCDDGVACTVDSCDEASDTCLHDPDHDFCDNPLFCDGDEFCDPQLGCQDGPNPCLPPTQCDEPNTRCVLCLSDAKCNDGVFCNGLETCDEVTGFCVPGTPPICDDHVACTRDECDPQTDACQSTPDNGACNDSQFCNGVETCDALLGCLPGTPPDCTDPVLCTVDSCNEVTDMCVHAPDNGECSDGQFCNGSERCDPLLGCQPGTPPNCTDGSACTIDACDETTDTCTHVPNDLACDNGMFCDGSESCDPVLGCVSGPAPNCNDGVDCTNDACNEAKNMCTHTPKNGLCNDGLFCNGVEACDPVNGCQAGTAPDCKDGIGCTTDSCNEATDMCQHQPSNSVCDDTFFCTGAEVCNPASGCVAGAPPDCDDAVDCTVDACDALSDRCVRTPDDSACEDNDPCTNEACTTGGCSYDNDKCGACCLRAGPCLGVVTSEQCENMPGEGGMFQGVGSVCTGMDSDDDGVDDACDIVETVPTMSQWGLVILTLLLLTGAKVYFGRRPETA